MSRKALEIADRLGPGARVRAVESDPRGSENSSSDPPPVCIAGPTVGTFISVSHSESNLSSVSSGVTSVASGQAGPSSQLSAGVADGISGPGQISAPGSGYRDCADSVPSISFDGGTPSASVNSASPSHPSLGSVPPGTLPTGYGYGSPSQGGGPYGGANQVPVPGPTNALVVGQDRLDGWPTPASMGGSHSQSMGQAFTAGSYYPSGVPPGAVSAAVPGAVTAFGAQSNVSMQWPPLVQQQYPPPMPPYGGGYGYPPPPPYSALPQPGMGWPGQACLWPAAYPGFGFQPHSQPEVQTRSSRSNRSTRRSATVTSDQASQEPPSSDPKGRQDSVQSQDLGQSGSGGRQDSVQPGSSTRQDLARPSASSSSQPYDPDSDHGTSSEEDSSSGSDNSDVDPPPWWWWRFRC